MTASRVNQTARATLTTLAPRLLAVVAWFGVTLQLWLSIGLATANGAPAARGVIAFLGYFTVLTNILVAMVCTAGSFRPRAALYSGHMVGAATAAALIVGAGYHLLLREIWDPQGAQWVADVVMHYVVPAGAFLHWLVFRPDRQLRWWAPLSWCWYPLAYFAYVMVRGEWLGSYPYPFIDVLALGYRQAMVNASGLLMGFVVLGYALLWLQTPYAEVSARARPVEPG